MGRKFYLQVSQCSVALKMKKGTERKVINKFMVGFTNYFRDCRKKILVARTKGEREFGRARKRMFYGAEKFFSENLK